MAIPQPDAVGRRLEQAREARGLSQAELARRSNVAASTLSQVARGERDGADLSLKVARRLCIALGVTMDWFSGRWLEDTEVPYPPEAEWLLATPGGLDQLMTVLLRQAFERLFARPADDADRERIPDGESTE